MKSVTSWRDQILKEFAPQVARLTVVADPDGLLVEEALLQAIRDRGFEVLLFEDAVAFRYAYELKFRSHWDRGESSDLVVVSSAATHGLSNLPYDLLQAGRQLAFTLGDLFPRLSYPVVATLDRADLDVLYHAQTRNNADPIGDDATKDFVLLHVFDLDANLIRQPSDLLRVLLRRHYRGQRVPRLLDERLVQVLRKNRLFDGWPLETIVTDREIFFAFLQERWPLFLDRLAKENTGELGERWGQPFGLEFDGPADLPFEHDDVRVYIDNLFFESMLQPIAYQGDGAFSEQWIKAGIRTDPIADRLRRVEGLMDTVRETIPPNDSRHHDWFAFANRWAELTVAWYKLTGSEPLESGTRLADLRSAVDDTFMTWVVRRYAGLHNQPPDPPVMLHHLPRYLARWISGARHRKVALIIVDGMALDQWIVLRDVLTAQRTRFRFHEDAVFAWIPTLTSVSRQAAFAGKPPLYFPSSIQTTDREPLLWTQFWVGQGLRSGEVTYGRALEDVSLNGARGAWSRPEIRVLGLVVDKVDKILHGMELGTAGMHNQVRQWARQGFIAHFLDALFDDGFAVFLTSDHGNIEAEGCGRPSEGAVADLRGERVRVYPDELLRARVKDQFPDAVEWPAVGLPERYLPLLAPRRSAFVREGQRVVAHGGISLEEVVVPFVQIDRLVE